jgi:hypothetical protein
LCVDAQRAIAAKGLVARVYMTEKDLGEPTALCFGDGELAADIARLASLWGEPTGRSRIGRDDWLRAWQNIRALADRLLDAPDSSQPCDLEIFHHLMLAVGNFKRQAGDIHLAVEIADYLPARQSASLVLPGDLGRLERDNAASWQALAARVPGLGIPTTTCLLAALWPDYHVIMDVYDRRAAVGLQVGRRSGNDERLDTASAPGHAWWFYSWFRTTVTLTAHTAGCELVQVERALFVLGSATGRELAVKSEGGWTWSQYYHMAVSEIARCAMNAKEGHSKRSSTSLGPI